MKNKRKKFSDKSKKNYKIIHIKAREILDSRGSWTVEVGLEIPQGLFKASAPSGASTGKYEAPVVSPQKAVQNINKIIAPELKGKEVFNQQGIDDFLKPEKFGANTTTAVSMAVCRAGAAAQNLPLYKYISKIFNFSPTPWKRAGLNVPKLCFNMINGGAHASNQLDFQEFMIISDTKKASEIYQDLRKKLGKNVGDEGGFAPNFKTPEEALNLLSKYNVKIIIDVAASQFFKKDNYKVGNKIFSKEKLVDYYLSLIRKYPIIGLEDPFDEDDFKSWQTIMSKVKGRAPLNGARREMRRSLSDRQMSNVLIIGDDLLVTNPERIKKAEQERACNGLLLKINQIGTITKALESAGLARDFGWKIMVSHRSGETNDDFIADFAVGIGADFIKTGAPARGERVAKYNRLLEIKDQVSQ